MSVSTEPKDSKSSDGNDLSQVASFALGESRNLSTVDDRMPESLRGLDETEYARLEKKLVRKMDYTIMPVVAIVSLHL